MKSRLLRALYTCVLTSFTTLTHAVVLPLESRLGGLAYYDPNLDITWTADANINDFDTWDNQMDWAAGLTIGGVSGWRLPSADVNGDGTVVNCFDGGVAGCEDNEMGFLFWEEGITNATPGPFSHVLPAYYWSSTEYDSGLALSFPFDGGFQYVTSKLSPNYAWAVQDGDVVPIPPAVWLFGSGLLGLVGIARRKKAA